MMMMALWMLLISLVHGELQNAKGSSKLLRQRRRILDMDALMEQVFLPREIETKEHRSLKKSKGDCNTGDFLEDMFNCGDLSMSMAVPSPPTVPLPPVAPSVPTIPISFQPTTAPFAACRSQDRSQAILAAIREDYPENPNGQAIDWLTFQDPAMLDPCIDDLLQRYALASFYFQTGGASWDNDAQWLSERSECTWSGVSCNANGAVQTLSLPDNNLVGPLPGELRLLTDLESLSVFRNSLSGPIPDLTALSSLSSLDVEENALTGDAFANARLPNMAVYRVSSNDLTGEPTDDIFTGNLKELWFANNRIEGVVPASIGESTQLTSIILYGNNLMGEIPGSIEALTSLEQFQGYDNGFSGPLPPGLFVSSSLRDLRLEQNQFTGTIPTTIGIITAIQDLRMGENNFSGTIPSEISMLSNLVIFAANATGLSGTIVDDFGAFSSLEFMDLSSNQLTGTIPSTVFTTPIDFLYLSDNMLTGTIPSNFAQATDLEDLYLFNNMLSGTVPDIASGELTTLTELRIENNEIEGTVPASICALTEDDSNENRLMTLISDCGGPLPQIRCDCCNSCVNSP